jgi:hypothetical protein
LGVEHHGGPLGCDGFDDGSGGELGGFDLEDTELSGGGGEVGFFAERAFGQTGSGFAGGDELAGELDEVGGDLDGRGDRLEDRRLAKGDLVVEGLIFGFVEGVGRGGGMRGGERLRGVAGYVFV